MVKRTHKNGEEITKTIFYKLQFIDCIRLFASSVSNIVRNIAKKLIIFNLNMGMIIKIVKLAEFNTKVRSAVLNTHLLKMV